jgi:thymidylate synthase
MDLFSGSTADEVWRLAYAALTGAVARSKPQASRAGETIELLHAVLEISDPRQRWILSRHPPINPAFAIAEALWILAGSNDADVLNYWFPRLPDFQGEGPVYSGAYGHRLRKHFGIDQVRVACEALAANPASRQIVLQLWDARFDLPHADGAPSCADIPCNVVSLLKVRDGRLEWTQIMRSNDIHRGLPYNLVQFTVLQEVMAGWLSLELGSYRHWSDSLHVYLNDRKHFSCVQEPREELNSDSLKVDNARGDALITDLYRRMVELTVAEVSENTLGGIISIPEASVGYQNLLRVLGAESARRRRRYDQAQALMASCTNPQLRQVWSAWWARTQGGAISSASRGEGIVKC